jgi:hypothetical protein
VTLASFRVFVSYTIQIAGLEDMIHRLSANIGNTAGSPANSDNATSPDKDIPSRSVQSTQVRDTTFGSVSSPTRSTSSNISMPTVRGRAYRVEAEKLNKYRVEAEKLNKYRIEAEKLIRLPRLANFCMVCR